MPVGYTPQNAKGVGGGWWLATGGRNRGKRFRIKNKNGVWYHDYRQAGKSRGPVVRIGAPAPRAPAAPKAPPAPGTVAPKPTPTPTSVPYRDSTYWSQRAKLEFQRNQSLAGNTQEQQYANQDFAEALRRRLEQNPKDKQTLRQQANREGLFYSGQLGKREGELATQQSRTEFDAQLQKTRMDAARAAAREAINQGFTVDEAALAAEAADRKAQKDAESSPDVVPELGEEEHGSEPEAIGPSTSKRGKPVKGSYLRSKGARRYTNNADGSVTVRFKTGALRTLKQQNGVWYIRRGSRWVKF